MATYLAFLAIGKYEIRQSTVAGKQFLTAYDQNIADNAGSAKGCVERTPEVLDFLASHFGPYPFATEGGVVSNDVGGALETQTRPFYGAAQFTYMSNM